MREPVTETSAATSEHPAQAPRRRQILGPTGLVVMVVVILLFTAVSIVLEVRANSGTRYRATVELGAPIRNDAVRVVFHVTNTGTKAGRPDVCEATLLDARGARAGAATVYLREPIAPGETYDAEAVGTVARPPANGVVSCRSMQPQ
jgi:hypothetical protein